MDDTSIPLDVTVAAAERRGRNYWADDGLAEVAVGVLLMLAGLLFVVEATAPDSSPLASMSAILLPLLAIGGLMVVRLGVARLRERITYPRTGYAAVPPPERANGRVAAGIAVLIAAVLAALLVRTPSSLSLPALDGIVIGAFLAVTAYRHRLARFYALSAASVLVGLGVAFSGLGDNLGTGAYFGIFGLILTIAGAATLSRYLKRTTLNAGD
jgi:hypothetical protein